MIKIAFIIDNFPKLSETFILNQITGLIDRGHEVDIYANNFVREDKTHFDIERYALFDKTYYYGQSSHKVINILNAVALSCLHFTRNPIAVMRSWNYFKLDRHRVFSKTLLPHMIIPFLKSKKYDIINCHFGYNGLKATYLKKLGVLQGKIVTTFHGLDITNYLDSFGENVYEQLFDTGDLFLPISHLWQKRLIEIGCNPQKIIVHHMGIDCQQFLFQPRTISNNKVTRLVTVARLVEKKGIEYGIRAVAQLAKIHPNLEYWIVGDGELNKSLNKLIRELKVERIVKLCGWKEQQEVAEILSRANIMLAPSVTSENGDKEGIPIVLMEAMAVGLPVVSTFHSGIPELIEDGVSGFLVAEKDVELLVQKLDYLIRHPQACLDVSRAARRKIENSHDLNLINDKLVNIYQGLLK